MSVDYKKKSDEELYNELYGDKKSARMAFEELYSRYAQNIFAYCKKVLNHDELAEDVFQETFTRLYESAQHQKNMTNVAGYILRIARNLCLNEKQRKKPDKVDIERISLSHYDKTYENKELGELVEAYMAELPEKYREALIMKEFMDLSYKEISEILNESLPIIRIRIHRAKVKLRNWLTPYLSELPK